MSNPFGTTVLGIVRLDGWGSKKTTGMGDAAYVPVKGDVDDAGSFPFPAVAAVADGVSWEVLNQPDKWEDPDHLKIVKDGLTTAFVALMKSGADTIIANCGLFMWCHSKKVVAPALHAALIQVKSEGLKLPRPLVQLSTLTYLPTVVSLYSLGSVSNPSLGACCDSANRPKVVIFTSKEEACLQILANTDELKGVKVFTHDADDKTKAEGEILVIGLSGDNVIGTEDGVVGDRKTQIFREIVDDGAPALFHVIDKDMKKVAEAVKREYPETVMGIIECTEVGAYTDTIRHALAVPVYDPIHLGETGLMATVDHEYKHVSSDERALYVNLIQSMPVKAAQDQKYFIDIVGEEPDDEDLSKPIKPQPPKGGKGYTAQEVAEFKRRWQKRANKISEKKGKKC